MSDFHMPDSWYDPPDDEHCEKCDDEGCHLCDRELARAYAAEMRHPERI